MSKTRINLYDDSLLPIKQRLTFAVLKGTVLALLLLLLLGGGWLYWLQEAKRTALAGARQEAQVLNQQRQALEQKLAKHKPDPALVAEVEELQEELSLKELLLGELGKQQRFTSSGYGALLTDLARVADGSVWLERILIAGNELRFEGYAKEPSSVPLWVGRLKHTETLQGKQFATMSMARGEGQPLAFVLTSETLKEAKQ